MEPTLAALLAVFDTLRPAFTRPGARNALVVFAGWVQTNGKHAVTQALVTTDVASRRHWEAFHRFFSRGSWDPDRLGMLLLDRLLTLLPEGTPITAAIDDTLAAKRGPQVFGLGSHLDAVRSTKAVRVFCFGHVWVMLAIVVRVPFSFRPWALPLFFRLYRNKKECKKNGGPYRKKTELARELLHLLARWTEGRKIDLVMDSAYCNNTVMDKLPPSVRIVGSMRPDAVLTGKPIRKPGQRGRARKRGAVLPKPQALARNSRRPWQSATVHLYGKLQTVRYKTLCAQWYRAAGEQLLTVVVVKMEQGKMPIRVFFSTDSEIGVAELLETYSLRWSIEVTFRDLKQLLGFGDSSARKKEAVERTAPFVGYVFSVLVIWFMEGAHSSPLAAPPIRPWYTRKRGSSFADILRTAQCTLSNLDVLDQPTVGGDLRSTRPRIHRRAVRLTREAA
jgi:hypothetical protein